MKKILTNLALALLIAAGATGCMSGIVKNTFVSYAEPTSGDLAHVRLIGSRDVKVFPASDCPSSDVPGFGYPAGPQLGGQRKRDLGMPKTGQEPGHYVEIAARGDEPITATFNLGRTEGRFVYTCRVAHTFVPKAGHNYEMDADWIGSTCIGAVYEILPSATGFERKRVASREAVCPNAAPERT